MEQLKSKDINFLNQFVIKGKEFLTLNQEISKYKLEFKDLKQKYDNIILLELSTSSDNKLINDEKKSLIVKLAEKTNKLSDLSERKNLIEQTSDVEITLDLINKVLEILPKIRLAHVKSESDNDYFLRCCKVIKEEKDIDFKIELDKYNDKDYVYSVIELAHRIHFKNLFNNYHNNCSGRYGKLDIYNIKKFYKGYIVDGYMDDILGYFQCPDISSKEIFSLDSIICPFVFKKDICVIL